MYTRESELVRDFAYLLRARMAPWPDLDIAFEFNYQSGRVDVVGVSVAGELFSFEAKLTYWRKALHQAYRSTAFSHHAYVVLPEPTAKKAAMYCQDFELRGVGLCSVSPSGIAVEIPAFPQDPFLTELTGNALQYITRTKNMELAWSANDTSLNAGDRPRVQQAT